MPNKPFDTYRSIQSLIDDFENRYQNHLDGKKRLLSNKAFINREIQRVLDGQKQYKNIAITRSILATYLPWLQDKLENETSTKKADYEKTLKNNFLMSWNGDTHVLTHIFYIMRNTYTKEGERLLPHSVEEVARFLKDNFDVYKNTKLKTIEGVLNHSDNQPKKTKVLFEIKPR